MALPCARASAHLDSMSPRLQCIRAKLGNSVFVTADTILVQDSEPIATAVEDTIVLLSIRAGAYLRLNGVGGQIWNMLVEPCRAGEIVEAIAQMYDAELDTIRHDVCAFLDTLVKRQLVRVLNADETR